jgi:peptidoglycan/xylan/chitin deacetylase (PgdA/CDA1 family)
MPTLLIGYDVEACAIGEGLACLGAHGLGEAIDRGTTRRALDVIRRNHEEHEAPATLFVCGRTLVHNVEALEPFVEHPLFDVQQHTYSHTLLKDDHWKGGTFLASPVVAIEQEVRQTSEALARLLGVTCTGLRTPHGYHLGLTDRQDMLAALDRCGIRFVSSWARNAEGVNPTPMSVQPFWYVEQGFDDMLEIPFQGWLDGTWFEEYGIDRADGYADVLRASIDEIVDGDLVYGACFHDWAQIRYREAETGWVAGLMSYARANGVEMLSYAAFHDACRAARVPHTSSSDSGR